MQPTQTARRIVLQHGQNPASYQIVNPNITKWFNSDQTAVIGYSHYRKTTITAGPPICPPDQITHAIQDFTKAHPNPIYFAVTPNFFPHLPDANQRALCIGSQPIWNPQDWQQTVSADPKLRAQFNRAKNKGITIQEWSTAKAENHPDLVTILESWLKTRGLPPLHFLVEPYTLSFLPDRRTFVALQNQTPVAFLNLCPVPLKNGYLTEQFPRLPSAPNGTVDLLMHHAAQTIAAEGYTYLTMGMVPLHQTDPTIGHPQSPIINLTLKWAKAHGTRFYNFRGLHWFKNKFHPHKWEDLYLLPHSGLPTFRHLLATAEAFTERPLPSAALLGLLRSIRQEATWLIKP